MGGENGLQHAQVTLQEGSSPRGRGKRGGELHPVDLVRLIPAWAGKTSKIRVSSRPEPAHPRVGGENMPHSRRYSSQAGSSPRGRGKPEQVAEFKILPRLIPAWAGKTAVVVLVAMMIWAHPRVGGENRWADEATEDRFGSSPRGRGKLLQHEW